MFSPLINNHVMIGEVLAGLSVASSVFGSLKSAEANKRIDKQLNNRQSELDNWYNTEYSTNYLDTDEAKSTLQVLSNQRKEAMKKVDQSNAIKGASDETRVATADRLNRGMADNVTRMAGYGTRYKDMIRRGYVGQKMHLDDLQANNLQNKSNNWSNFMNNSMNAGMGFAEAAGGGAFDDWDGKITNFFKARKAKAAGGPINKVPTDHLKVPLINS